MEWGKMRQIALEPMEGEKYVLYLLRKLFENLGQIRRGKLPETERQRGIEGRKKKKVSAIGDWDNFPCL
jgi:hypothetical protein